MSKKRKKPKGHGPAPGEPTGERIRDHDAVVIVEPPITPGSVGYYKLEIDPMTPCETCGAPAKQHAAMQLLGKVPPGTTIDRTRMTQRFSDREDIVTDSAEPDPSD